MTPITANHARESAMKALDKLPALSQTVGQLLGTLAQSVPDITRLERIINKDPALAGLLLSVANSAAYSRYSATSSTMDAISRLGYSKLKRFALSQAFAKVFRFGRPAAVWSPTRFHLHSSAVGMASELIADKLPVENMEHAFLCGLMHDIGKLLIAVALPDHYQRIDAFAMHGGSPMEKEFELLGITHAELSGLAAERWKLPHPVCDAVARHHSPTMESLGKSISLSRLTQASNAFVNSLGITVMNIKPEGDPVLPSFNGHALDPEGFAREFQSEWEAMSSLCF
jgi:putative nucleotidyltransferase with HDIG domain